MFHHALQENNFVNDGDFDWIKRLQEHRNNRQKAANQTTIVGRAAAQLPGSSSADVTAKTIANTYTSTSASTPTVRHQIQMNDVRPKSAATRTGGHCQLPVNTGNMTTITLNGGSKTTLSMASTSKIPVTMSTSRTTNGQQKLETGPPPPTKRRGFVPTPVQMRPSSSSVSNQQQISSTNLNNSNSTHLQREPVSSLLLGQPSEPTCCFFKRKAKRALQISSTASRKA